MFTVSSSSVLHSFCLLEPVHPASAAASLTEVCPVYHVKSVTCDICTTAGAVGVSDPPGGFYSCAQRWNEFQKSIHNVRNGYIFRLPCKNRPVGGSSGSWGHLSPPTVSWRLPRLDPCEKRFERFLMVSVSLKRNSVVMATTETHHGSPVNTGR